eukprot:scaffold1_cov402-Prasinococcus_capsulatus_cf.AAC.14
MLLRRQHLLLMRLSTSPTCRQGGVQEVAGVKQGSCIHQDRDSKPLDVSWVLGSSKTRDQPQPTAR